METIKNVETIKEVPKETVGTVGSNDELGKEIADKMLVKAQGELEAYERQKDLAESLVKEVEKQWLTEDARWQIILNGFERITPEWKYELDPQYNVLSTKIMQTKYRKEKADKDQYVNQQEASIKNLTERIDAQKEEIVKIKGE